MNRCYLCGARDFSPRQGIVRDRPEMKVVQCDDCGLVCLDSTAHIHSGFYENSKMHGEDPQPMEDWLKETHWDDSRRFEQLKSLIINKDILDFGCGAGGFLLQAKNLARTIVGVELEARVREYWKDSDFSIFPSIEQAQNSLIRADGYDVITAFHVVEHLSDPRKVLKRLGTNLKADGRLIVEVPSADDALLTLYKCDSFQRFTYWSQHLYLFTASTLATLIKQAGLEVVSIQHHQRYPLSNHLYWLSRSRPGGHQIWSFLDSATLSNAYAEMLASIGKTDTLIAHIKKC